jgi:signal transduction histidine kinase
VWEGGLLLAGTVGMSYFQKLRRLNKKIAGQSSKIEGQSQELRGLNNTIDKFFGIIAHDLRNPLLAFQG